MGIVCPLGNNVPTASCAASRGKSGLRRYQSRGEDRVGGTVELADADAVLAERHEPATRFALAAAQEAIAMARLDGDRDRIGCVVGAGLAGATLWERAVRSDRVPRMAALSITGTAVTGLLALQFGLRGPSFGIANACASGTSAILAGLDQIRLGRADAMLVGGCESSMRGSVSYGSFVEAGMHVTSEPANACTPFAAARRGFVLAEGAAILVLERLEHARARGVKPLAILAGGAITNDAHHAISPDPSGQAWARVMRLALADADAAVDDIDAVNAHATATRAGDIAETRALHLLLGARASAIPISATKSMHGHAFGAAGAIETVLAIAAMQDELVLPTVGLDEADPECDLDYVPHHARRHRTRAFLKNGFGAGGVASALVIRRAA